MARRERRQDEPEATGPVWLGWVMRLTEHGVTRVPVRLPQSVVDAHATGPATSPDMRSMVAAQIEGDVRHDRFLDALVRERSEGGES